MQWSAPVQQMACPIPARVRGVASSVSAVVPAAAADAVCSPQHGTGIKRRSLPEGQPRPRGETRHHARCVRGEQRGGRGGRRVGAPPRQHHRLRAALRLAADAGHVGEVRTPLPAVHAVVPPPPHVHALLQQRSTELSGGSTGNTGAVAVASARVDCTYSDLRICYRFVYLTVDRSQDCVRHKALKHD